MTEKILKIAQIIILSSFIIGAFKTDIEIFSKIKKTNNFKEKLIKVILPVLLYHIAIYVLITLLIIQIIPLFSTGSISW